MPRYALASASLALIAAFAVPAAASDDVLKQTSNPAQWALQTGDYANHRYLQAEPDHPRQRQEPQGGLDVLHRRAARTRRLAAGDRRHHVRPHPVPQYRLRPRPQRGRQDPLEVRAQAGSLRHPGDVLRHGLPRRRLRRQHHLSAPGRHHGRGARRQDRQGEVEGRQRRPEEGRDQYGHRASREGQGDRRHLGRRVRRARPRDRLRRQDRQAACGAPTRWGPTTRCWSTRRRPRRSASRSARTPRSRPGTAISGRSAAARAGAGTPTIRTPTSSTTAPPTPRPGTRRSAPAPTASPSTRSGPCRSSPATRTPAWRSGSIR